MGRFCGPFYLSLFNRFLQRISEPEAFVNDTSFSPIEKPKEKSTQTSFERRVGGFLFGKMACGDTLGWEKCNWNGAGGRLCGFLRDSGASFVWFGNAHQPALEPARMAGRRQPEGRRCEGLRTVACAVGGRGWVCVGRLAWPFEAGEGGRVRTDRHFVAWMASALPPPAEKG